MLTIPMMALAAILVFPDDKPQLRTAELPRTPTIKYSRGTVTMMGIGGTDHAKIEVLRGYIRFSIANSNHKVEKKIPTSPRGRSRVKLITFRGHSGNDIFENQTGIPSIAYGGGGNDILKGGSSWNRLYGESGNDELSVKEWNPRIAKGKRNLIIAGSGNDILIYHKGDKIDPASGANEYKEISR